MGCCFSKISSSNDNNIQDNLLSDVNDDQNSDNNSSSTNNSNSNSPMNNSSSKSSNKYLIDEQVGPTGDDYPIWIKDDNINECYNCYLKFNLTERKHHCRRCRNIFCYQCTSYKSSILIYNIKNDVKVCQSCKLILVKENLYLSIQQPLLFNGELFVRYRMFGFTKYMVKLKLLHGCNILIYYNFNINDDKNNNSSSNDYGNHSNNSSSSIKTISNTSESTIEINLSDIIKINNINLQTFEIITKNKNYLFEADSINTMKTWVEALNQAICYQKQPSLRQQIENDRLYRNDEKSKLDLQYEQAKLYQLNKDNRYQALNNIRNKYGIA